MVKLKNRGQAMHLLTEDCLNYYFTKEDIAIAKDYYDNGCIKKIGVMRENDGIFSIEAKIKTSYSEHDCKFKINYYEESIFDHKCDCPFEEKRPCLHIAIVSLFLLDHDLAYFPWHYELENDYLEYYETFKKHKYDEDPKYQLNELLKKAALKKESAQRLALSDNKYQIIPEFRYMNAKLYLNFYVGDGTHRYVIKNYREFINDLGNEKIVSIGKYIEFVSDRRSFDERSQKYLGLMAWLGIRQKRASSEDQSYKRYALLDQNSLDLLNHFFKDDEIKIADLNFKIRLHIEDRHDHYLITLVKGKEKYLAGENHLFIIEEEPLLIGHHVTKNPSLIELVALLSKDPLYIDKKSYETFYEDILKECEDEIEINDASGLRPSPKVKISSRISIYGDIQKDDLLLSIRANDEKGQSFDLVGNDDYLNSYEAEMIMTILNDSPASIDNENHLFYMSLKDDDTYDFIEKDLNKLSNYADVYISEAIRKLNKKVKYTIKAAVKRVVSGRLALEFSTSDFDYRELKDILKAYRLKKRYYLLKSGEVLNLRSDELLEIDDLLKALKADVDDIYEGEIELDPLMTFKVNEKLKKLKKIAVDKEMSFERLLLDIKNADPKMNLLPEYRKILRNYQKKGFEWLSMLDAYNFSGLLADEMGLGKTIQIIALLETIKEHSSFWGEKHHLVVCPSSLIYNWEDELKRFGVKLSYLCVSGDKVKREICIKRYLQYDLLITSYDYLRRDIDCYENCNFDYVIIDEAQNIKNYNTKNAQCTKRLKSIHRLALSGTPIENSLAELWSIFDFLMPGYLSSYQDFRKNYEFPIVAQKDKAVARELKSLISPFILRRMKKDVLKQLPDKVDHRYLITFKDEEKKLYDANLHSAYNDAKKKLATANIDHIGILALLTRLRQLCLDPRLIYDDIEEPSSKLEACLDLIKLYFENGKKVLVFSAFVSLLDLLAKELEANGISYYKLAGSTPKEERHQRVNAFQNDDTPVFLISLKAGGTGLNLTAAEAVIHLDPWWNLSAQNQASDRAHRIGQNANVQVYRLIMKDSIEEKIETLQKHKEELSDSFIKGNDGFLAAMSKDDIMALFNRF